MAFSSFLFCPCLLLSSFSRYIFICHPIMAKVWCTQQRVSRAIIAIFTLAFIHQLLRFFEGYYIDTTLKIRLPIRSETFDDNSSKSFATFINDIVDDDGDGGVGGGIFSRRNRTAKLKNIDLIRGENVSVFDGVGGENDDDDDLVKYSIKNACQLVMSNWIDKIEDLYFGSYFVFRIVFVHIGPCLLLVLFNVLLYNALKRAEKIRNKLLNLNPNSKQIAIKKNSNSEISGGCVCVCNNLQQNHRKRSSLMSVPSAQIDHKIGSNPGVPSETNDDRSANSILIIPKRQSQCNDYHKCFTPSNSLEQNSSNNSNMADNNHNNNNNIIKRLIINNDDSNEIPLAIATAVHVLENMLKLDIVSDRFLFMTIIFSNFLIIISYPLNFAIYCGMSKAFRETFKQMFLKNSLFHHIFYNSNPHNHNHHHHHHHHQHHAHANHQHYHRKQSQQIDGRNSISFSNRKSSEARVINEDETSKKSPRYHRFLMLSKRSQTNQSITTPLISTTASISMTTTTTTTTTMNNNASNNTVSFVENDQCPSASDPLSANNLGKSGQFHIDDDFDVDNGDERDNHQEDGEKTQATESIIVRINNQETMFSSVSL
ncbi:Sex peptide receptor [Sarcoptes scabiei]|uniref:Sex peptide receptor n=1 Tax=Sarcoptes scabiei TaxID=52283 RepID=A0A834VBT4_SARSC|nr:Sex peptide receptor [Sarcoptes scabiei]